MAVFVLPFGISVHPSVIAPQYMAKAHREAQLDKYPKPENKFRWP